MVNKDITNKAEDLINELKVMYFDELHTEYKDSDKLEDIRQATALLVLLFEVKA